MDPSVGDSVGGHSSGGNRSGDGDSSTLDASVDAEGTKSSAPVWMRLSGAGLELAFITIVFGAAGAWIDSRMQSDRPIGSALLGLLGFVFGMVRFIRLATSISQTQREIESARFIDTAKAVETARREEDARGLDETNKD